MNDENPIMDRGLNLSRPDATTEEELAEFRDFYTRTKGYPLPAFEFWAQHRPDVLKRYRMQARQTPSDEALRLPLANTLAFLHYYAIVGYEDGILYEVRNCESIGATKPMLIEALGFAFLHAGPRGMRSVYSSSHEHLSRYGDSEQNRDLFPANWDYDYSTLAAGIDYSNPDMPAGEVRVLRDWYLEVCGEVPPHVEVLSDLNPRLLKAYRHRFERTLQGSLPKQMIPYFMIHFDVIRGFGEGIREGVLLARGLGVTREQVGDAISWGMLYGGPSSISIVQESCGDVLSGW